MSSLFGGKSKSQQPTAALGLDIQTAEYGKCLPVAFGRNKWAGTVIWYGQFKSIKHTQKPAGSKGGGSQKQTSYTYTCSYMVAMSEGSATASKCYDGASEKSLSAVGGVGFAGTLGQAAWSNLVGNESLGYSGTSVIAFQNKDLGDNPSLPQLAFEMNGLNQLNAAGGVYDADPKDIATTVCTDTRVGVNFSRLGDLAQWSNYCRASGLLFSPVYDTQQAASQVLTDLLKFSNAEGWYSEGVLKVKPRGDRAITGNGVTFTPDLTPAADLGPNDLITNGPGPAVQIKRKSPADSMNVVRIEYKDRAQKYRTVPATATIDDDVVNTGVRAETSETVDMITGPTVGQLVASNIVARDFYVRNTYDFKVSWRYCYLEPMDIVRLTDAATGLNLTPVRIREISEDAEGLLAINAEEMPDGIGHADFLDPQSAAAIGVDPESNPGPITTPYFFRAPNALVSPGAPEVWVAVAGDNALWAGCDVYISRDGSSYTYHSTFARESTYGATTTSLGVTADPYTTGSVNITLNGGETLLGCTAQECDDFVTLTMIDDEIISYQTATLAAGPSYNLGTRIRRGGYGSAIASHAVGAKFVRLDEDILRIPVDPSQVGSTIYVKFVSLNCFGRGGRTLADETAYAYVIGTRSDFPDVPAIPTSFIASGVADGINLKWSNVNPAAVACTSIEFAPSASGPWTVLGQAGPTETTYHHAFSGDTTYYYRARARGHNVAGGWSNYTATVSATAYGVAGSGINIMLEEYSRFSASLPSLFTSNSTISLVLDAAAFGGYYLRATTTGTVSNAEFTYFGKTNSDRHMPVEPGDYILSFYAKASVVGHLVRPQMYFNTGGPVSLGDLALTTGRTRYSVKLTVPSGASLAQLLFFWNMSATAGRTVDVDGIMLEPMVGALVSASSFVPGNTGRISYDALIAAAAAQDTADGKIVTFFQTSAPTGAALGDIWFDSDDGNKAYRYNGASWVVMQDTAIATAIANAAGAQATADGKVTTFYQAAAPTAVSVGDLWVETDDGNKLYRWNGSAWVSVRDTTIATAQTTANTALANAATAQATADGKIDSFYQTAAPGSASEGDLWFDTDDGNKCYTRRSGAWVLTQDSQIGQAITAAAGAQATADGKVTTFYQAAAPTAEGVGDLWVNTTTKVVTRWNGSAWVTIADITLDKLNGRGANLCWDEYSRFNNSNTFPALPKDSTVTLSFGTDQSLNGAGSLKAVVLDATGTTAASWVYFGNTSTDYRLPLEGGKKYILSAYVRCSGGGQQILMRVKGSDGVFYGSDNRSVPGAVWTRLSVVLDLTAFTGYGAIPLFYLNRSGVTTSFTMWIDRIMIEELVGNDTTPSAYVQGPSGLAAERAIANAATAQATADGKIDSFYQASAPGSASEGDLWFDTDDGNKCYTRRSGAWVLTQDSQIGQAITSAAGAQATADGKVTTFYTASTPTAGAVGDLWFNTATKVVARWNGSVWATANESGARAASDESVINGDFELGNSPDGTGPIGWTSSGTLTELTGANAYQGNKAIKIVNSASYQGLTSAKNYACKPDEVWLIEAATRCISGGSEVRLFFRDAAGGTVTSDGPNSTASGWTLIRKRVVVPAGAAYFQINLRNSGATGESHWDSVRLSKVRVLDDEVDDGSVYGRYAVDDRYLSGGRYRVGLRIGTSGHRIGAQRNLIQSITTSYGTVRSTTALSATSAGAVSVNAFSQRYGSFTVNYSAVSNAVTGLTQGTSYVIYCSDPDFSGGTKTYFAGTNPDAVMQLGDDIVVVGQITIPTSGSSAGGGGSGGGGAGDWCVDWDTVLPDGRLVRDLKLGDLVECIDIRTGDRGFFPLLGIGQGYEECFRVWTENGRVIQSRSTAMDMRDGSVRQTINLLGEQVFAHTAADFETVLELEPIGVRRVVKPDLGKRMFFAGEAAHTCIATHNIQYKP